MTNLICKACEGHNIRIVADEQGEPWFVASDIATVLGYPETNSMNKLIDEDDKEKRVLQIGGNYVNGKGQQWLAHKLITTGHLSIGFGS
ncbi:BRO-N domain-containing protein [Aeromonas finlandensis]|uniref:BRO-N domain-containing protein n=1 Tax=Aeromonas finlandensis TaxID=1543375 RepID=UPI00051B3B89|nr:BRO family protein [Aeromonas finlandensis]